MKTSSPFHLFIGNKNYSSWSLRPWLVLKHIGIEFQETVIPLYGAGSKEKISTCSPSGKVPALKHGENLIWDSMAICEYLAETFPDAKLWPENPMERAQARSICAEMHSGFLNVRKNLPMNIRRSVSGRSVDSDTRSEIDRLISIWTDCRRHFGKNGPFLFGRFSIADAVFAPVVTRFQTYGIEIPSQCEEYSKTILNLPAMQEWSAAGRAEPFTIANYET